MWIDIYVECMLNICKNSKNLDTIGINEKNLLLVAISDYHHNLPRQGSFYCCQTQYWTVLTAGSGLVSSDILFYENKV